MLVCSIVSGYVVEPTILAKIEKTLTNDSLADVVLEQSLICLKEDWMKCVVSSDNFNNSNFNAIVCDVLVMA